MQPCRAGDATSCRIGHSGEDDSELHLAYGVARVGRVGAIALHRCNPRASFPVLGYTGLAGRRDRPYGLRTGYSEDGRKTHNARCLLGTTIAHANTELGATRYSALLLFASYMAPSASLIRLSASLPCLGEKATPMLAPKTTVTDVFSNLTTHGS